MTASEQHPLITSGLVRPSNILPYNPPRLAVYGSYLLGPLYPSGPGEQTQSHYFLTPFSFITLFFSFLYLFRAQHFSVCPRVISYIGVGGNFAFVRTWHQPIQAVDRVLSPVSLTQAPRPSWVDEQFFIGQKRVRAGSADDCSGEL